MRSRILAKVSSDWSTRSSDLRAFSPAKRHNQGRSGACPANSTTRALENKRIRKYGQKAHIPLSRAWLYFAAREAMEPQEIDRDEGTHLSLVADALKRKGVPAEEPIPGRPAEEAWGWSDELSWLCTEPSWMATRAAYVHKVQTWSKIRSTKEDKAEDILVNLAVDNPIVIGLPIDSTWDNPRKDTVLTSPKGVTRGAHAIVLVGFDAQRGVLIGENSWGNEWCDDGFFYLDVDYVVDEGFDLIAFQNGWEDWKAAA